MKSRFSDRLIRWNREKNTRVMPWKGEKDPYRIWLSEVILQQTRVEQGLGYYERFLARFPSIEILAAAKEDSVFKLWEGLGYYSRCRNLLETARTIMNEYNGVFPQRYDEILKLKGVGPYIAAAIASFAYNLPHAVLDGNVFRVLSRIYGINKPVDSTEGKKTFRSVAEENLDRSNPGLYNQAIMDFGATVCKPISPCCDGCVMESICVARKHNTVNQLPVKEKSIVKKQRWFYYFLLQVENRVLIQRRNGTDIWCGLHEFYLYESPTAMEWTDRKLRSWLNNHLGIRDYTLYYMSERSTQQLTHQKINGQFISLGLEEIPASLKDHAWVSINSLRKLAFPALINQHLKPH
ncbi:MAG TPA: A/G-specific adenine glycosylase [Chitinophagaceae bacterium]